jgi:hypothetical protein
MIGQSRPCLSERTTELCSPHFLKLHHSNKHPQPFIPPVQPRRVPETPENTVQNHKLVKMHRLLFSVPLLVAAAIGAVSAEDLKIDVTLPVECDRKTKSGDKIDVHYSGTLTNGEKFDASSSALFLANARRRIVANPP